MEREDEEEKLKGALWCGRVFEGGYVGKFMD